MADLIYTADYSELTGMIKTIDQTKRAVQLLGNTLANTKDSSSYMRGINQVVQAQKKLAPSARMSRSEIMKLGAAMKQEADFAKALAAATEQAGVATGNLGKKMSRTGVVFQQAGYQIGDFAVQVQSGTHYMVALGQQLTQLVGVGAMLARSTAWIAAFSALGVIVPIATAVAGAIMRTRDAMDEAAKKAKFYQDRIKSLDSTLQDFLATKEAMTLGLTTEELFGLKGLEAAKKALDEATEKVEYLKKIASGEIKPQAMTQKEFSRLGTNLPAAEEALRIATERYKLIQEMTAEKQNEFVQNLDREFQLQQEIKRFGEDSLQVADLKLKFEKEDLAAQAKKLGFSKDEIALLVDKLSLIEETRKQIEAAERAQKALLEDTSAAGDEMVKAFNAAKDLREEIGEGAVKALELAGVDITSGVDAAAKAAARLADNLNVSLGHAINIMNLNEEVKGRMVRRGVREGTIPPQALADLPQTESERAYEQLMAARRRAAELRERESSRSGGGGGGGAAAGDRIGALAQSLATERELLDMWYQDSLIKLQEFNAKELELLGGHAEAKERLEQEHQDRLAAIEQAAQQRKLSETAGLFGALANIASTGGKKMAKIAATFGAIEATINAYKGATAALADPNISVAGRLAAYASVLAAGLQGVAAIRQAGGIGGGSGGSGGGGVIATPTAAAASPQRVIIEGIGPNDLITGSQLSEIFDRLYEENENRGLVFQIAS